MKKLIFIFLYLFGLCSAASSEFEIIARYALLPSGAKMLSINSSADSRSLKINTMLSLPQNSVLVLDLKKDKVSLEEPTLLFACSFSMQEWSTIGDQLKISFEMQGWSCKQVLKKFFVKNGFRLKIQKAQGQIGWLTIQDSMYSRCGDKITLNDKIQDCSKKNPGFSQFAFHRGSWHLTEVGHDGNAWADPMRIVWKSKLQSQVIYDEAAFWCQKNLGWDHRLPEIADVPDVDELYEMLPLLKAEDMNWTSSISNKELKMAYTFGKNSVVSVPLTSKNDVVCVQEQQP